MQQFVNFLEINLHFFFPKIHSLWVKSLTAQQPLMLQQYVAEVLVPVEHLKEPGLYLDGPWS